MSATNLTRVYDDKDFAEKYKKYRRPYPNFIPEAIMRHLRQQNPVKAKDERFNRMLDVGCGSGRSAHMFAKYFDSILGIDISEGQINVAKENNVNDNVTFQLVRDNLLPVEENSVDLIGCGATAHYLDMETFLPECERVLKPGGCVAMYFYFDHGIKPIKGEDFNFNLFDLVFKPFHARCGSHKKATKLRDGYKSLFDKIPYDTKTWVETGFEDEEWSLTDFMNYASAIAEYHAFMKNSDTDPLKEFATGIKKLVHEEESKDEDVRFILRREGRLIMFSKK